MQKSELFLTVTWGKINNNWQAMTKKEKMPEMGKKINFNVKEQRGSKK